MNIPDHSLAYRITYSIPRAARLLRVSPQLIRSWVTPRLKMENGKEHVVEPLCKPSIPSSGDQVFLTFFDVAELNIICTMIFDRKIRRKKAEACIRGWRKLRTDIPHYLINRKFRIGTSQSTLLVDIIDEGVRIDPSTQQFIMTDVIIPEVLHFSYFGNDDLPYQWKPKEWDDGIIISPAICRGKPVVAEQFIPTESLAVTAKADGIELTARQYGISVESVRRAVEFEKSLDSKKREAA